MKYKIKWALGGGMHGGTEDELIGEYPTEDAANNDAYERACETYDSYAGLYGLRDTTQIMEEDDVGEDEAYEIFREEREGWLNYSVELIEE